MIDVRNGALARRAMRRTLAGLGTLRAGLYPVSLAMLLSACTTTKPEPTVQTVEVDRPVYKACTATIPALPAWADSPEARKASPDIAADLNIRDAGIVQRDTYIGTLTTALAACIQAPSP